MPINLAVIAHLTGTDRLESLDQLLAEADGSPKWPVLAEKDPDEKIPVNDASLSVRLHPKWKWLPCILIEFIPSMLIFNQSGIELTVSVGDSDQPEMILAPGEVVHHSKIDRIRLGGIYGTILFQSKTEICFSDQSRPHWIADSDADPIDVPLEGTVPVLLRSEGDRYGAPVLIESAFSRGVRRIFICPRFQFQNQTSRRLHAQIINCKEIAPVVSEGSHQMSEFMSLPVTGCTDQPVTCQMWTEHHQIELSEETGCRRPFCLVDVPTEEGHWAMVTVHKTNSEAATRFVITEMNARQPPRYLFQNETAHQFIFFEREGARQFTLCPMGRINFESQIENEHFPDTSRGTTVKLHVKLGEDSGAFYLHPGDHGMQLKNTPILGTEIQNY